MAYGVIQLHKENGVATITLNRPPMNPLNSKIYQELSQAADEIKADTSVKVVIITGSGEKAFAAGADIMEMVNLTPIEVMDFCRTAHIASEKFEGLGKPVIAAVNGLALGGGCELALAADFRIASEAAKFALPEVGLGIIPGAGGTQRLSRLIGVSKAKEMIMLGDMIDAAKAEELGIVNWVVPAEALMDEARKIAGKLSTKPAVAIRMAKEAINTGINLDINSALTLEIQNFVTAFASEDRKEGLAAFVEKRKPNYTDK